MLYAGFQSIVVGKRFSTRDDPLGLSTELPHMVDSVTLKANYINCLIFVRLMRKGPRSVEWHSPAV